MRVKAITVGTIGKINRGQIGTRKQKLIQNDISQESVNLYDKAIIVLKRQELFARFIQSIKRKLG